MTITSVGLSPLLPNASLLTEEQRRRLALTRQGNTTSTTSPFDGFGSAESLNTADFTHGFELADSANDDLHFGQKKYTRRQLLGLDRSPTEVPTSPAAEESETSFLDRLFNFGNNCRPSRRRVLQTGAVVGAVALAEKIIPGSIFGGTSVQAQAPSGLPINIDELTRSQSIRPSINPQLMWYYDYSGSPDELRTAPPPQNSRDVVELGLSLERLLSSSSSSPRAENISSSNRLEWESYVSASPANRRVLEENLRQIKQNLATDISNFCNARGLESSERSQRCDLANFLVNRMIKPDDFINKTLTYDQFGGLLSLYNGLDGHFNELLTRRFGNSVPVPSEAKAYMVGLASMDGTRPLAQAYIPKQSLVDAGFRGQTLLNDEPPFSGVFFESQLEELKDAGVFPRDFQLNMPGSAQVVTAADGSNVAFLSNDLEDCEVFLGLGTLANEACHQDSTIHLAEEHSSEAVSIIATQLGMMVENGAGAKHLLSRLRNETWETNTALAAFTGTQTFFTALYNLNLGVSSDGQTVLPTREIIPGVGVPLSEILPETTLGHTGAPIERGTQVLAGLMGLNSEDYDDIDDSSPNNETALNPSPGNPFVSQFFQRVTVPSASGNWLYDDNGNIQYHKDNTNNALKNLKLSNTQLSLLLQGLLYESPDELVQAA